MRRSHDSALPMLVLMGAVALVAGACSGGTAAAGWTDAPAAPSSNTAAAPTTPTVAPSAPSTAGESLSLTILSDTMTGKAGWPVLPAL
jgi:hypothetical protein